MVSCYGHILAYVRFICYFDYKSADCHQPLIISGSDSLFVYIYFSSAVLALVRRVDAIFQQLKQS